VFLLGELVCLGGGQKKVNLMGRLGELQMQARVFGLIYMVFP